MPLSARASDQRAFLVRLLRMVDADNLRRVNTVIVFNSAAIACCGEHLAGDRSRSVAP
jgi:hypothetical protein